MRNPLGDVNNVQRELFVSPSVLRKVLGGSGCAPHTPPVSRMPTTPRVSSVRKINLDESVEALLRIDLNSPSADAEILRDAVVSARKVRPTIIETPEKAGGWKESATTLKRDVRDKLSEAMLDMFNEADENELCDVLAGIGNVRAARIVDARVSRSGPFESVDEVLRAIGLSDKLAENIILANMKHILLRRRSSTEN